MRVSAITNRRQKLRLAAALLDGLAPTDARCLHDRLLVACSQDVPTPHHTWPSTTIAMLGPPG